MILPLLGPLPREKIFHKSKMLLLFFTSEEKEEVFPICVLFTSSTFYASESNIRVSETACL